MRTLEYARAVYPMALLEELQDAGIPAAGVRPGPTPADPVVVGLDVAEDDTTWDAATDATVAAHDPQAIDQVAHTAKTAYDLAIQYLQTFSKQTPGTATAAQQDRAIQALITVAKAQNADLRELQGGTP